MDICLHFWEGGLNTGTFMGLLLRETDLEPGGIQWGQKVRHEDINVGGKYYWAQNEYQEYAILS